MIAGLLPHLARDLDVTLPAIGHLVTTFSLVYAIGAPTIAMLTAGLERRRLLAIAMAGFSIANLLAALAPSYAELLIARLLLALSAASFMPAASGYAAALGGPERRGRALSTVTNGLTLAIIAGVPLGVLVGESFGWRATFLSVAGLATLSLLGILVGMPSQPPVSTAGLGERLALAKRPDTMAILATSVLTVSASLSCPLAGRGARACASHARYVTSHSALGFGQLGPDDGTAGAAGRAKPSSGRGQSVAELVGHLSRQRYRRGHWRAGHRPWRSGSAGWRRRSAWPRCCRCWLAAAPSRPEVETLDIGSSGVFWSLIDTLRSERSTSDPGCLKTPRLIVFKQAPLSSSNHPPHHHTPDLTDLGAVQSMLGRTKAHPAFKL
ncbi:MFS transporter [Bradyrhizobium japonicum]|uniref:MFS transporter n=1 Tax=Bradyrhizobium japonicum TaxID=375 RepID=UPI0020117F46|nr:MFS transporter [Bradyrhizobium japonicum]